MRGVLGGVLPQAPTFSDHVAALPQEAQEPAQQQTSAASAEPAASGSSANSANAANAAGAASASSTHASGSSSSSAPSATSAPAPAGNTAAAASGGRKQDGAQSSPKNAQKGGTGRIENVPPPGKSSGGPGNAGNRHPRQGKGRR